MRGIVPPSRQRGLGGVGRAKVLWPVPFGECAVLVKEFVNAPDLLAACETLMSAKIQLVRANLQAAEAIKKAKGQ